MPGDNPESPYAPQPKLQVVLRTLRLLPSFLERVPDLGGGVSRMSDQAARVIESANSPRSPCLVARDHERVYTGAPFGDCSLQGSNMPRISSSMLAREAVPKPRVE